MLDSNHQGGIKQRSSTMTVTEIFQHLAKAKSNNETKAIVTMDQSAAYDIIPHLILKRKMLHIGIHKESVEMIMSYLHNRKQQVYINGNMSDKLLTGEVSDGQGSVMSGLLYLIYTLI